METKQLENSANVFEMEGDWHVLRTKSRQEKILAADLAAMSIGHYLPLARSVRFYGKRRQIAELPLFSGYIFVRGCLDDIYRADRTKRVAQVIKVADQQQLEWELRNLDLALGAEGKLEAYPYLQKGVRVEVRSGPMRGLQGVIEERGSGNRIILQIQTLGRAVSMEIDAGLLERVQ